MAYNSLSGAVISPLQLAPPPDGTVHILSGNLSTSDGADVVNVPRVSNATNNSLITNVGGDANNLTCETNLTFDGSTLNVVGDLTASVGISASVFFGDGSQLTGIAAGSVSGSAVLYSSTGVRTSGYLRVSGSSVLAGGIVHKRKAINSNYVATTSDYYIGVDSTSDVVQITLPAANTLLSGQTFIVKDEGGAADTYNITVSRDGGSSDKIDGENQVVLSSPFAAIQLYCNGNNKFFVC